MINTLSLWNQGFAGLDSSDKLENLFCMQGVARSWIGAVKKKENWRKERSFSIMKLWKT